MLYTLCLKKSIACLFLYNLMKPEPKVIVLVHSILIILPSKGIYNFCIKPHAYLFYFTVFQGSTNDVFSHIIAVIVNLLFNEE